VAAGSADVTIVSVGANDTLHRVPVRSFEADLSAITTELLTVSKRVVLAGVGDLGAIPGLGFPLRTVVTARSRMFDRVHARVAARHEAVRKIPVTESTDVVFRTRPGLFCPDLFHPNADGHAVWAAAAYPVIAEVLAELVAPADTAVLLAGS
jgi:lysophospholipase L1-like esterase